jgi:hypothetical protein
VVRWYRTSSGVDEADDLASAVALQVQAAWARPNLLGLMHAWLLQATAADMMAPFMLKMACRWVDVQLAPAWHPVAVQLGLQGPAVAAAVAALGSICCKEVQVSACTGEVTPWLMSRLRCIRWAGCAVS